MKFTSFPQEAVALGGAHYVQRNAVVVPSAYDLLGLINVAARSCSRSGEIEGDKHTQLGTQVSVNCGFICLRLLGNWTSMLWSKALSLRQVAACGSMRNSSMLVETSTYGRDSTTVNCRIFCNSSMTWLRPLCRKWRGS
jgi:hypothetical protein